jgi:hypothetical protein
MHVEGDTLVICVDLTQEHGPSSSGKMVIMASTEGNVDVPSCNAKVGLNVYKPRRR